MPQHCISVMRAERLELNILAPKKLSGMWTVNRSESRTTLILYRYCQARKSFKSRNRQLRQIFKYSISKKPLNPKTL